MTVFTSLALMRTAKARKWNPLSVVSRSFIVPGQSSKSTGPGEASFYHPSTRQQHEASFCHGVLDHFESDAVLAGSFGGVRPCVSLVDLGQFDRVAGDLLDLLGQRRDLTAVSLVGRRDGQR